MDLIFLTGKLNLANPRYKEMQTCLKHLVQTLRTFCLYLNVLPCFQGYLYLYHTIVSACCRQCAPANPKIPLLACCVDDISNLSLCRHTVIYDFSHAAKRALGVSLLQFKTYYCKIGRLLHNTGLEKGRRLSKYGVFYTNKVAGLWTNVYIILQLALRREKISIYNQSDGCE